jgi:hypothetical protein
MFRPLGHLQDGSWIFGGKSLVQQLVMTYQQQWWGGVGGNEISFYNASVEVSVWSECGERAGYRCANRWSVSIASSESAVWTELETVGWSMLVLGPHRVYGVFYLLVWCMQYSCVSTCGRVKARVVDCALVKYVFAYVRLTKHTCKYINPI